MYSARGSHCDMEWRGRDLRVQKEGSNVSDQQTTANITVSEAIRQALESGCETNAAILSSVQAATGKIPSPSTISQIRKKLGMPANSGRGRPRKIAVKVVPAAEKSQKNADKKPSPAPVPVPVPGVESVSAEDFVAVAKAIRPFSLKFHASTLLSLVDKAIQL